MLLLITIATALVWLSSHQASIDVVIDYDCYCSDAIIPSSGEYWCCYWLRLLLLWCDYLVLRRVLMLLLITIGTALVRLSRPQASIDVVIDYDCYCSDAIISSSGEYWYCYWLRLLLLCCDYLVPRRVLLLLLITIGTALVWLSRPQASIDVVIDYDWYCSGVIISSSGEYWCCYWLRLLLLCCDYLVLRRVLMLLLITIATALMRLSRPQASIDVVIDYDWYCSDVIISSSGEYWCCYWLRLLLLWCDYLVLRRVLVLLLITIATALMRLSRPQASIAVVIDYDWYCSGVIISSSGEYWCCYWLRLVLLWCDYLVLRRVLMLLLITIATALVWLSRPQASIDGVIDYDWYCSGVIISSSGEYWCCYWLRKVLLGCDYLVLRRVLMLLLITIGTALVWLSSPQASIDVVIDYDCYCSHAIISSSGEYWCCYWLRLLLLWCDYLVIRRVLMLLLITIATALMRLSRPRASIDVVIDYDCYCSDVIISSSGEYWCCYWLQLVLLWCDYLVLRRVLMLLLITIATALMRLSRPRASIDIVIDYDCYCSAVIISSSVEYWCCYWLRLVLLWCDYLVIGRVLILLLITIGTALVWLSSPQASIDVVIDCDCYCSDAIISSSGEYWYCYWLRLVLLCCDYLVLRRVLMLLLITIATALMWLSRPRASIDVVIDYDCYCSDVIISSSGEYWCCYWLRLLLLWCDYLVLRRVLMLLLITIGTALMWLSRPQASIDVVIDYDCYCSGVIISSSGEYWCCYWLRLLLLCCDYPVLGRVLMLLLITIATALMWLSRPQASIDVVIDYNWYCSGAIISSSGEYWCCYWLRLLLLWCDYLVLRRVLMLLLITIATALMRLSRPKASIDVVIDYDCYCSDAIISSSGEYWYCYWLRLLLLCCDYLVLMRVLMLLLITIGTALMWLSRPRASIDIVIDYDWYCSGVIISSSGLRRVLMLLLITIATALVWLSCPQASIDIVIDYDCYCSGVIISSSGEYWCCYWLRLLLLCCDYLVLRRVLMLLLITIATALMRLSRPQASIDVVIDYDWYCSDVIISSSGEYWCCYWLRLLLLWCDYLVLRRVLMLLLITIATALMRLSRPQASIAVVIDYDWYCSGVIISSSGEYWCCYWYFWYCSGVIISSSGEYWCCYWLRLLLLWCDYLVLRRVLMLLLITIATALMWLSRPQASIDVVIDYDWYCSAVIISSSGEYWCCYWLRLVLLCCDYLVFGRVLMLLLITIGTALVWLSSPQASIVVVIDNDCYCSAVIISSSGEYWCCYWLRLTLLWCDYLVLRRVLMLLLITIATALMRLSRPRASIDVVIDYDCYCSDVIISSSGEYWCCYWLQLVLLWCDYLVLRRVLMLLLITIATALMRLSRHRASIDIVIDYDCYCSAVII